jgi:hypothetical protein
MLHCRVDIKELKSMLLDRDSVVTFICPTKVGMHCDMVDDHGTKFKAAQCRVLVKRSAMESTDGKSRSSKLTD